MVGNLIDNAAKWAGRRFQLVVEQDTNSILIRGVKLDESSSGSGLGLAIARELAALYGGDLNLERSDAHGRPAAGSAMRTRTIAPEHRLLGRDRLCAAIHTRGQSFCCK